MGQTLVRIDNLNKAFGWRQVFSELSFCINSGDRIAVVGANGVGKTTLARIIAGLDNATSGAVIYLHDHLVLGYLPQDCQFPASGSARNVVETEAQQLGAAARCHVDEALHRFGLTGSEESLPIAQLSGGQKTRLALARMWLSLPDLLILDEPTNHLDQEGCEQLAEIVRGYPYTVLVISHDRYFLDQIATRVLEMQPTCVMEYHGNYSDYRSQKQAAFEQQVRRYETEQREIKRIEEAIDRQMRWFKQAHDQARQDDFYRAKAKKLATRGKATVKRLERMKENHLDKPKADPTVSLDLSTQYKKGVRVFVTEDLGKQFSRVLFRGANFAIMNGDKIGLLGGNGTGKTTLIRMLLGQEAPTWGSVWSSPSALPGYLEQEMQLLRGENTLLNSILSVFPQQGAELQQRVRHMLASFLFEETDWNKPLAVLSEGERRRVALIRLLLGEYNVLLLDEPTNHLDLPTREKLEEAMRAYAGTMIVVSHDRYLVQTVCNKILAIGNEQIIMYPGTYQEYLRWQNKGRSPVDESKGAGYRPQMSQEERLVLENRLAWLSAQLDSVKSRPEEAAEIEAEYFAVSKALRRNLR